ncbi:bifunctional phosphoribosyl-AMP cyclohydrolase/phosphoribosyl-ATP diphosphatase HisIE [Lysobacter claricitrinus]|uniref:bifunctional phosphoribosyl-AMP cyclohydrolase/phosphoribosyl-ATP diphosphatase HisIE n=1 Tax=Lysobacter claricitrinus TaxID=3367728 RepID=UPI0037DA905C
MVEPIAFDVESVDWTKQDGLLAAVVQDATTLRVLMVGWMDRDALAHTMATRQATFFSRTRQRQWTKGETSGHILDVVDVRLDCDADTVLVLANPRGPTCHLDRASCFPDAPDNFLGTLDALVERRARERPAGSYTTTLLESGMRRIAQKVGEEGVETALAAVAQDDDALLGESADLLYHLVVLLRARGLSLDDAVDVLRQRHGKTQ